MPRRSRPSLRPIAVAVLLLGTAGCSGGSGDSAAPAASPSAPGPTPLAEVSTTQLTVARADFCAQVAPDAVAAALGGVPARAERWRNGQRARLADGLTDVAHEYGCRWRARGGATATAWVFAPPVTAHEAAGLRRDALHGDRCREALGVPEFGRPTVAVRCVGGGVSTVTLHGLFGDAWLSCALSEPVGATRSRASGSATIGTLVERAEQWCVDVAFAAEG